MVEMSASDAESNDTGAFELDADTRYMRTYRRPADNEFGYDLELQVQAWYEGWRVRIEHAWADPDDTLAEGIETKEAAIEYAEKKAREYSDY